QNFVRQKRKRDPAARRIQQTPEDADRLPPPCSNARPPPKFTSDVRGGFFECDGIAIINNAAAVALLDQQGNHKIIDDRVIGNRTKLLAANGINRAIRTEQRSQAAFLYLQKSLVFPIETVYVFAGCG